MQDLSSLGSHKRPLYLQAPKPISNMHIPIEPEIPHPPLPTNNMCLLNEPELFVLTLLISTSPDLEIEPVQIDDNTSLESPCESVHNTYESEFMPTSEEACSDSPQLTDTSDESDTYIPEEKPRMPKPQISRESSHINKKSKKITKPSTTRKTVIKMSDKALNRNRRGKKHPWKSTEDTQLLELVAKHGNSWSKVGQPIGNRTGKQVRDRYRNYLKFDINNDDFTQEEDDNLLALVQKHGHRWGIIAHHLPGRSEGQIKNRYYVYLRKTEGGDDISDQDVKFLKKEEYSEIKPANQKEYKIEEGGRPQLTLNTLSIEAKDKTKAKVLGLHRGGQIDNAKDNGTDATLCSNPIKQEHGVIGGQSRIQVKEEHGDKKSPLSSEDIKRYRELLSRKEALDFFCAKAVSDIAEYESKYDLAHLNLH